MQNPENDVRVIQVRRDEDGLDFAHLKTTRMTLLQELTRAGHVMQCWESVYESKSKKKRRSSRGIDGVTLKDYEKSAAERIPKLNEELRDGSFIFSPMMATPIEKDKGGYRVLSVPTVEDRIVHKALLSVMTPKIFEIIDTGVSYCGVKADHWEKEENGVSIKKAILKMISHIKHEKFFIFETDIKSFFAEVPKERMLERLFMALGADSSLNPYLEKIVHYELAKTGRLTQLGIPLPDVVDNGISQGSALSPILANLYLSKFDLAMKEVYGDRFIRYVDDFIVVCETAEEAAQAKKDTVSLLKEEGLLIADNEKTRELDLRSKGAYFDFLGVRISADSLCPRKSDGELKQWLQRKVLVKKKYEPEMRNGKLMNVTEQIDEVIQGWGMYNRFYHVEELFASLDFYLKKRKKEPAFRHIKLLSGIKREPIIDIKEWRSCFTRK